MGGGGCVYVCVCVCVCVCVYLYIYMCVMVYYLWLLYIFVFQSQEPDLSAAKFPKVSKNGINFLRRLLDKDMSRRISLDEVCIDNDGSISMH